MIGSTASLSDRNFTVSTRIFNKIMILIKKFVCLIAIPLLVDRDGCMGKCGRQPNFKEILYQAKTKESLGTLSRGIGRARETWTCQ